MKNIRIIRHGETTFNIEERIQGATNDASVLTDKGMRQADDAGRKLRSEGISFDAIYSSDLKRAKQTTEQISKYFPSAPINYTSQLWERGFGELEGKTITECNISDYKGADLYYAFKQEGIMKTSEPLKSVYKRLTAFVDTIKNSQEKEILIVGHEWINSYLVNILTGEGNVFHPQNNAQAHYIQLDDAGKVSAYLFDGQQAL